MYIKQIQLKNFRCFDELTLNFDNPLVLISGLNGAGKTSLLEALHYAGYLKSFRASTPRDLLRFGAQEFFIKTIFEPSQAEQAQHELQVGFSAKKRLVKLNQKAISSFKELMDHYRIVTITEDDVELIKGGPEQRRAFVDQALVVLDAQFLPTLKQFKQILDNRNALLHRGSPSQTSYDLWTEQLWHASVAIVACRQKLLGQLQQEMDKLLSTHFKGEFSITLQYQAKNNKAATIEQFMAELMPLQAQEVRFGRSLFGAHLDDIGIQFQDKQSRAYASRGQQKLTVILLKLASWQIITACRGPAALLLDDFMTDFDDRRLGIITPVLASLPTQLIFTSPAQENFFDRHLIGLGAQRINLST